MEKYLSPRALADAIGVSESSLKRWADEGRVGVERTAGGHRRIPLQEAVRFIRSSGLTPVRPDLLELPAMEAGVFRKERERELAPERLFEMLLEDRSAEARSLIVSLYMEGASPGWIFDVVMREALARVGKIWVDHPAGIFIEHRATETCAQAVAELRLLAPAQGPDAPVALGGGFSGDVYLLPSAMAAVVTAEAGFREHNLGPDSPAEATIAAIRRYQPRLIWQSFSAPPAREREVLEGLERIARHMGPATLLVGGRESDGVPLPIHPRVFRLDSMSELGAFARGILASPAAPTPNPETED